MFSEEINSSVIESMSILYARTTALLKTADVFNDQKLLSKTVLFKNAN